MIAVPRGCNCLGSLRGHFSCVKVTVEEVPTDAREMFDRCSIVFWKISDRCSIDAQSMFGRVSIDVRSNFDGGSIEALLILDRC